MVKSESLGRGGLMMTTLDDNLDDAFFLTAFMYLYGELGCPVWAVVMVFVRFPLINQATTS